MIILRYLLREVLITTAVIALVIFLLSFGRRFSMYLEEAWQGRIAAEALFAILGYRIPQLFMLNLPISFFIAILLSYGRMYVENEMVVLSSCGVSKRRLMAVTFIPAGIIAAVVAALTLYLGPMGLSKSSTMHLQQKSRSDLSILSPNRPQPLPNQPIEIYFERFANVEKTVIENVFIAEMNQGQSEGGRLAVLTAATGQEDIVKESGQRFLLLENVFQYDGVPGAPDYLVQHFDSYRVLLEPQQSRQRSTDRETLPTSELLQSTDPRYKAELHWRIALPLVVLIGALIAVPLSYTSPRQGRFFKLFPALVVIILYLLLLNVGKTKMEKGDFPVALGLWWVHGIFLVLASVLLWWNNGQHLGKWRSQHIRAFKTVPESITPVEIEVPDAET